MPDVEIRPFSDEHLDGAARLLAARHRHHRAHEPLLPGRFEDPAATREEVEKLTRRDDASGWVGLRDDGVAAYVIGTARDDFGPGHVWVEYAGHAADKAEDMRDLYAVAAEHWVGEERLQHYVQVPAYDTALIESWFRLSFGQQQADGVREVPAEIEARMPDGFEIRAPTADDVELLIDVDLALPRHHRSSPVFSTRPLPTADESRAEWRKTLADDRETVFVGFRGEQPVAAWSLVDGAAYMAPLIAPERTCYLGFAATIPEARGSGIGVALTDAALAWAVEQGYVAMATDWRVTNLLASRFWPRRGFRPTFFRLYRHIP